MRIVRQPPLTDVQLTRLGAFEHQREVVRAIALGDTFLCTRTRPITPLGRQHARGLCTRINAGSKSNRPPRPSRHPQSTWIDSDPTQIEPPLSPYGILAASPRRARTLHSVELDSLQYPNPPSLSAALHTPQLNGHSCSGWCAIGLQTHVGPMPTRLYAT